LLPLKDNIPTDRLPIVTIALIVANVLMYFLFQKAGVFNGPDDSNVIDYGAIPREFTHWGEHCQFASAAHEAIRCGKDVNDEASTPLTALTSMFMHGSIIHLGGNMLFLWIFGNNVEDSMGRARFVVFYLLGGLAALLGQVVVAQVQGGTSEVIPTIGASGAVAAVLGGYLLLFPRARVLTIIFIIFFFTIVELPAMLILGFWFLQQILFGAFDLTNPTGQGGGVAYFAHIGGFAFGLVLIRAFAQREKQVPPRFPVY
jgi:membrane associated rhomboid family serine protease